MQENNNSSKISDRQLKERLEMFKIIPDVLSEPPNEKILIIYRSGVKVNLGNLMKFYQYKKIPCLFYWPVRHFQILYSIVMIDIDFVTSKDSKKESYVIFLVLNIQANDIMKGDIVAEYEVIEPLKNSGQHRILILGFKQPSYLMTEPKMKNKESRLKFSLNNFIKKYNLETPIVCNFFITSN